MKNRARSLSVPSSDIPQGNQSMSVAGAPRQTFCQDGDDDRPGKFSDRVEQPLQSIGTVNVVSLHGCVSRNSKYGLRGVSVGEASCSGAHTMGRWSAVLLCIQGIRIDVERNEWF